MNPKGEGISNIREMAPRESVSEDIAAGFVYLRTLSDVRGDKQGWWVSAGAARWPSRRQHKFRPSLRRSFIIVAVPIRSTSRQTSRGPRIAHYGEKDPGVNKGIPETEAAMKKYNKAYDYKIYRGAQHAFNNETGPAYQAEAANESWQRTLAFFAKNLQS